MSSSASVEQPSCPRWFWPALLGICLVGAVLRFLLRTDYLAHNPLAAHPLVDALTYWNWAGRIAAGQLSDGVPFFSAPLYPYLLGLLRAGGGELSTVYTIQILIDLVTAGLLAWIARLRFGPSVGLLAAAIFLLMLEPASFCLRVLASTLQLALICLAWLALLAAQRRTSLPRGILAGAALGLLALSYPPAMLCLPIFGLWWWWIAGRKPADAVRAAICVVAGLAVISPATIHNYRVSGEFFPIQSVLGINFRQGNGPGATGIITMIADTSGDREELFRTAQLDFRRTHGRDGSWKEIDSYYRDQALAYWREDPLRTARLFARKAYWFLTGRNYGDIYQPTMEIDEGLTTRFRLMPLHTAWLIPLALVAVAVWLRRFVKYLPELMLFGVPLLVVVVFWFSPRYRLPAIPVLVVAGAWVLWQGLHWRGRRWWSVAAGLALAVGVGLGFVNRAIGFDRLEPFRAEFRNAVGLALHRLNTDTSLGSGEAPGSSAELAEAATWYRKALEANPRFPEAHANLGNVLARLGRSVEALQHLQLAVRANPKNAVFHDQLGRVLVRQQRIDEAVQHFRTAVRLNPNHARLRNNLGNALLLIDEPAAAIEQYTAALEIEPAYAEAHFNLGRVLAVEGDAEVALQHMTQAARFNPKLSEAHEWTARILLSQGRIHDGIAALRRAYALAPQNDSVANDLAWYLATTPGLSRADRARSVELARQAVTQAPHPDHGRLDTFAAALAANGRFDEAVRTLGRAISLAEQRGARQQAEQYRQRLELYKARKPYVESITPTAP